MKPRTRTILSILTLALSPLWLEGGCKKEGASSTTSPGDASEQDGAGSSADGPSKATTDWEDPLADLDKEIEKPKITLEEQLERGEEIYDTKCAGCHGEDGTGKKRTPALMGNLGLRFSPPKRAKKRKMPFETAANIRTFVYDTMPPKKPGSLSDEDYDAVVAFLLRANAIDVTETFGYHNASEIMIPTSDDL